MKGHEKGDLFSMNARKMRMDRGLGDEMGQVGAEQEAFFAVGGIGDNPHPRAS